MLQLLLSLLQLLYSILDLCFMCTSFTLIESTVSLIYDVRHFISKEKTRWTIVLIYICDLLLLISWKRCESYTWPHLMMRR